jgi:hypothetical protein
VHHERKMATRAHLSCTPPLTELQMLFTWNTENLCIIFRWWHIRSLTSLLVSLAAIVLLTTGYEALREITRRYEKWVEKKADSVPSKPTLVLLQYHRAACFVCSDIAGL